MRSKLLGTAIIGLFYLIPAQDLIASFCLRIGFPVLLIKFILLAKEVIVFSLGLLFILKPRISVLRLVLLIFVCYSFIFIFVSKIPFYYSLVGFRTYLLLLFAFILGESVIYDPKFLDRFLDQIKIIFFLLAVFAFLEYLILPNTIWIELFPIIRMKNEIANIIVPEYFQTGMPVNAFGELTRRMLGPFNEPLYMAYFTVLLSNFFLAETLFFKAANRNRLYLGSVIIILTQTRAIIIGLLVSFFSVLFRTTKIKTRYVFMLLGFVVLCGVSVFIFYDWFFAMLNSVFSTTGRNVDHLKAYLTGFHLLVTNPFGQGLGVSSNVVGFSIRNVATENSFINIGIETGILGLILFILIFLILIKTLHGYLTTDFNLDNRTRSEIIVVGSAYLLVIQFLIAGLVAPHILTARILIPFMIIEGLGYAICKRHSRTGIRLPGSRPCR